MRLHLLIPLLFLAACESRTKPASTPPASSVLTAYHNLYEELGEQVDIATALTYPHKPGLALDSDADHASREQLIQLLQRLQPQIARIQELSTQDPNPIPAEPEALAPDNWPRAWLNRCASLIQADAGRLWDAGDADHSAKRVTTLIRLGSAMMRDSGELMQMWGLARAGAGAIPANAMLDAGLFERLTPESKADLLNAAASIRVTDEHKTRFAQLAPQTQTESEKLLNRLRQPALAKPPP